jgi:hypothetical protein
MTARIEGSVLTFDLRKDTYTYHVMGDCMALSVRTVGNRLDVVRIRVQFTTGVRDVSLLQSVQREGRRVGTTKG